MRGKTCVVTGGSAGIGKAAAVGLGRLGAEVVLVVRSRERGEAARAEVEAAGGTARIVLADLSSQRQVRRAAAELLETCPRIDVLVCNAAVYTRRPRKTEDGIESQLAVNHLSAFLLTTLLAGRLAESAPARVVVVSSGAHRKGRIPWDDLSGERRYPLLGFQRYCDTKLANILFVREAARRWAGTGVTANAMHPGRVATDLLLDGLPLLKLPPFRKTLLTPEQGADTVVWLASAPEVEGVTGRYFVARREVEPEPQGRDDGDARRLWALSEELTAASA